MSFIKFGHDRLFDKDASQENFYFDKVRKVIIYNTNESYSMKLVISVSIIGGVIGFLLKYVQDNLVLNFSLPAVIILLSVAHLIGFFSNYCVTRNRREKLKHEGVVIDDAELISKIEFKKAIKSIKSMQKLLCGFLLLDIICIALALKDNKGVTYFSLCTVLFFCITDIYYYNDPLSASKVLKRIQKESGE